MVAFAPNRLAPARGQARHGPARQFTLNYRLTAACLPPHDPARDVPAPVPHPRPICAASTPAPITAKAPDSMQKKVFIKTFGCQMNEYDSDKMADVLGASDGLVRDRKSVV